ncbi:MAG TPA: hypothetical protein VJ746_08745 [Nitrospira sp.]|nr:hypothetical protein [Nitrospira sp.]
MSDQGCVITGCQGRIYAPAGTRSVCKEHFLSFLAWRRRKGPQMFTLYAGLSMGQRDAIVTEWQQTVSSAEIPAPSGSKT